MKRNWNMVVTVLNIHIIGCVSYIEMLPFILIQFKSDSCNNRSMNTFWLMWCVCVGFSTRENEIHIDLYGYFGIHHVYILLPQSQCLTFNKPIEGLKEKNDLRRIIVVHLPKSYLLCVYIEIDREQHTNTYSIIHCE